MAAMVLIGLGANRPGRWGPPKATLRRAMAELAAGGLCIRATSRLYETAPLGTQATAQGVAQGSAQADATYVNAVIAADTRLTPEALLQRLKHIERQAGRRSARPWGPRALDLDLLDHKGMIRGWRGRFLSPEARRRGHLVLPHPQMHLRPFVLLPLTEILPNWRHPVLKRTARELWHDVQAQRQGRILRQLS